MKIGIDARFVGPQGTGLGKYTEKLVENLQKIDKSNQYSIFLKEDNWSYLKILNQNFKKVLADIPWYSASEQIKMPRIFTNENLDILHVPHFNVPILYRKKFIVTIHDLIHNQFQQESTTTKNPLVFKIKRYAYSKIIKNAITKSQKIIVPSNATQEEILKAYKVDPNKIKVIYEAAEEEYFQMKNRKSKVVNRKKQLLYIGNAYPHKNLNNLLDAIIPLDIKLTIVCPRNVFKKRLENEIEKKGLIRRVQVISYQQPDQLAKIMSGSTAYLFPSLAEGFGIPGLNAMAAGIPVIASNIPTLKEVYDDAAIYFDPKDPKDITQKIKSVISSPQKIDDLVKKGKTHVQKYSWLKMAQETLAIYKETI